MKSFLCLLLLIGCLTFSFTSCDKNEIKSKLSEKISHTASRILINELECSNGDLVRSDMKARTDKLFKVEATKSTLGGSKVLICKTLSSAMLPVVLDLMKSGKLSNWGCKVEKGEAALLSLMYKGCDGLAKPD